MKISNPLTIIAVFAGVAEVLACVALVQLPLEIQHIFVYFVMGFPAGIVGLFFFVLYFKNTVLYAPSDFENQDHYLEANKMKASVGLKIEEIFAELNTRGSQLSREEIERAKTSVEDTIEETASLPRKDQVVDFLRNGPATVNQISQGLNLHPSYCSTLLSKLELEGKALHRTLPGLKGREWYLRE